MTPLVARSIWGLPLTPSPLVMVMRLVVPVMLLLVVVPIAVLTSMPVPAFASVVRLLFIGWYSVSV